MNLDLSIEEILARLREEHRRIETCIAAIEAAFPQSLESTDAPKKSKRGRKSMESTERAEVSARMKKYWAERRRRQA